MLGMAGIKVSQWSFKLKSSRAVPLFDGTALPVTQIERVSYETHSILYKTH